MTTSDATTPEADAAQCADEFQTWFVPYMESGEGHPKPIEGDAWQDLFAAVGQHARASRWHAWQAAWSRAWNLAYQAGYTAGRAHGG